MCVLVCSPPAHAQHVTGQLFSERVCHPVPFAFRLHNVIVFINAAKVDAGCVRVVKLVFLYGTDS